MSKLILTGLLLIFGNLIYAQVDSLQVKQGVWLNVSGDLQIKDARSYETQELGYKWSKGRQTFVVNVAHKSNPYLKGTQAGLAYYRAWRTGYFNLSVYARGSKNFPQLVTVGEGYFSLPLNLELRTGIRHSQAVKPFSIASLGLNSYLGKFYLGYTFHWVTNKSSYHTGFVRLYLEQRIHMIELAFGSAALEALETQSLYLDQRVHVGVITNLGKGFQLKTQAGLSLTQANEANPKVFIYQLGLSKAF
jgi:hypothetical protein